MSPEKIKEKCIPKPPILDENEIFLGASNLVELRCNESEGRHVIAKADIKIGDVLFVEKAFAFAPVFHENYKLLTNKCFYCLSDSKAPIPCKNCTLCFYCDEECRTKSWEETHRWECKGMLYNLWSVAGSGFPAFRILLKGLPSKFENGKYLKEYDCIKEGGKFGSRTDNYEYVNTLQAKLNILNQTEHLISTAIVLCYLEMQTDFFEWINEHVQLPTDNDYDKIAIGTLIMRHIAQLSYNASLIEHYKRIDYTYVPTQLEPVASGVFPSVSMMNHSCKANISIYYINDVSVVKAADNIQKGEQVFNCYGIHYREGSKNERQEQLQNRYSFTCHCKVCENPRLELAALDTYKCIDCDGPISIETRKCLNCKKMFDKEKVFREEKQIAKYFERDQLSFEDTNKCCKLLMKIFTPDHKKILHCYDLNKNYYLKTEQFEKAIEYFRKALNCRKKRLGENSWNITTSIILFLHELKVRGATHKNRKIEKDMIELYESAIKLLPLDYPDAYVKYNALKSLLL